jgi:cyclase
LLNELSKEFGSQCVVLAIDTKKEEDGEWYVYLNGGRTKTEKNVLTGPRKQLTEGREILLTSMNHDGTKNGFAIEITKLLSETLPVPIIASGCAGNIGAFC